MTEDDIRAQRMAKVDELRRLGIDPYPPRVARTVSVKQFLSSFANLADAGESSVASNTATGAVGKAESLAGRVMSVRQHGGIIFADLFDGTARVQLVLKQGETDEQAFDHFVRFVDAGDFVSATGIAFTTKRGEPSLKVDQWQMAAKSLMPLPSEWYGIKDEDLRFRQRYLDILLNEETRALFERRSNFWQTIRSFLLAREFIEVETPIIETEPGGADARPFVTHHNALDMQAYLRISAGELWQKRLLVAGFPRVFEIGRIFRNEGMSNEHLQDYTQLEFYQAFSDFKEGMTLLQELYRTIVQEVYGTTQFTIRGHEVDFAAEWKQLDYATEIQHTFGIDPVRCTEEEAIAAAKKAGIALGDGDANKSRAVDLLWKKIRQGISGPAFLTGVPVFLEPLAKRDPARPDVVERFQIIIAGSELGKGFSELNDPVDQRGRFEEQQSMRDAGDDEAQRMDESYVEALEFGMPPAFGFGMSERLFSFLENKNVRETQLFPLLRPKTEQ